MYRHIIPTDGSELAWRGVAHGLALAKSVGAKVCAINVVEPLFAVTGDFASVLDRVASAAKEAGVSCETFQVENVPPMKPSSQPPRTKAAISLSCRRMGSADFPCFSSAV
jgi:hypothetical protein